MSCGESTCASIIASTIAGAEKLRHPRSVRQSSRHVGKDDASAKPVRLLSSARLEWLASERERAELTLSAKLEKLD